MLALSRGSRHAAFTKPRGWVLAKTADGLGYDLIRSGFSIIVR